MKNLEKLSEKLIELGIDVEHFYNPTDFSKTPHGKAMMMEDIIVRAVKTFGDDFVEDMLACISYMENHEEVEERTTSYKDELLFTLYHDLVGGFKEDKWMLPRVTGYSKEIQ